MGVVYPFAKDLICEGLNKKDCVLDVGCADRQYEMHIPCKYEGVDITVSDQKNPPTYVTSAACIPCEADRFDLVFGIGTFCVIPHVETVFSEMRRILKPGGRLLVIDYQEHVGRRLVQAGHANAWSYKSLSGQLREAGFSEVKDCSEKAYRNSILHCVAKYFPQFLSLIRLPPVWLIVEAKK